MLTVNLLPEELRVIKKKTSRPPYLIYGMLGVVVFLLITVSFYFDYLAAGSELKQVESTWRTLEPQSKKLKNLEFEVEKLFRPEKEFLAHHAVSGRPLSQLLMLLSAQLPETSWLTEIQMLQKDGKQNLMVKGIVLPGKNTTGIEAVEIYVNQLQKEIADAKLSLTTTRQKISELEVTQFIANFDWMIEKK